MTRIDTPSGATPDALRELAQFAGTARDFWPYLAARARALAGARQAVVYARRSEAGADGAWQAMAAAPDSAAPDLAALCSPHVLTALARDGVAMLAEGGLLLPVHLAQPGQGAVLLIAGVDPKRDRTALAATLAPLCAAPLIYEGGRATRRAARDAERLAETLDLTARLLDAETFDQAALGWVNGLAEQFACESVTLVWRAREGMRLRAISHAERVDRRTEASALAEQAAEEALAQGQEVVWPAIGQDPAIVTHSHGQYAALVHPGHLISLPMTTADGAQPLGAVLLERRRAPFTAAEQWALRLHCELARAPLERFHRDSHWLPRRVARAVLPSIPRALRPRTRGGRVLLAGATAAVIAVAFIPVPFRISAPAVLRTDAMAYVSAPFDGYLEASGRILGDVVTEGDTLFEMDRTELTLERNTLLAELAQANRQAEIRRADGALSEMQIAQARAEEVTTQLMQIDLRLAAALAHAPMDGVVVEGEPAKMIGEPLRRGDPVVTLAALSSLYVEAAVSERDLSFVEPGQETTITLLAQPGERVSLAVASVIPAATVQDGGNVFPVRMVEPESLPDWWLPGMTGVAKIHVGPRPLAWLATRRLVDYLRLALWI